MENFAGIIVLALSAILQNTIVTRINLLAGAADLVLLVMLSWILQTNDKKIAKWGVAAGFIIGFSSATPIYIAISGYLIVVGLVSLLLSKIWQAPYWMLLTSTFIGTIIVYGVESVYFWINGYPFVLDEMLNLVILPSVVLNILFVIPVYLFVGEIVKMVSPSEVEA